MPHVYEVRAGDSPAKIAIEHAGCPKCAADLVRANAHKEAVAYPNGFKTFRSLQPGERIHLPEKWFNGELDSRPKAYFAALPHSDGVTPGKGSLGVLGDYATFDNAFDDVLAIKKLDDSAFSLSVSQAASLIEQSVREIGVDSPGNGYAQAVRIGTGAARQKNNAMAAALVADDRATAASARSAVQGELDTALEVARMALNAHYGDEDPSTPPSPVVIPPSPSAIAGAQLLTTIDPCAQANVATVCAAQSAMGITPDGKYGQDSAQTARRMNASAPPACSPRPSWWAATGERNCPGSAPPISPLPGATRPETIASAPKKKDLSTGAILGITLLGVGAVGGAIYYATSTTSPLWKKRHDDDRQAR